MTAADPRDVLRNDFLHGIVADEVASALLAIGIEAVPEGYLETIASEIVRRYMGGDALAHARPEAVDEAAALALFTEYFVKNYPGPQTIISDPNWHAPRIFRAAKYALKAALTPDQSP